MKRNIYLWLLIISIISGCIKEEPATVPVLSTNPLDYITITAAIGGGKILSDGGSKITASGVTWGTSRNPTISDSPTMDGIGLRSFKCRLDGLDANTEYYIRAYATNSEGTSYGDEISFTTYEEDAIFDYDGNAYNIVTIGNQIWMAENLKTTRFNDGSEIPLVTQKNLLISFLTYAYCWYNNDSANYKKTFGALYNWNTATSGKICPAGWHVPSRPEWETLVRNAGSGGTLKEEGISKWYSPNIGATDDFGFKALPGGMFNDRFYNMKRDGQWWSVTEYTENGFNDGWSFILVYNSDQHAFNHDYKNWRKSIRCIKNQ